MHRQYVAPNMHDTYVEKVDVPTSFCTLDDLHRGMILNIHLRDEFWGNMHASAANRTN